jgi:hypothetical protein
MQAWGRRIRRRRRLRLCYAGAATGVCGSAVSWRMCGNGEFAERVISQPHPRSEVGDWPQVRQLDHSRWRRPRGLAAHLNGAQSIDWSPGISAPDPEFYLVERPVA